MVFSSLIFLYLFMPLFFLVYRLSPVRHKNMVALLGSYCFYAWGEPAFAIVLLGGSVIDYQISVRFHSSGLTGRKFLLFLALGLNLGLLLYYKYMAFLLEQAGVLFGKGPEWILQDHIVLPVGISFFTFQKISYLLDVYRQRVKPADSFKDYALYVALFPQLIAGPIVRYHDISREIRDRNCTRADWNKGLLRFGWGLAKKVLWANLFGEIADSIFGQNISSAEQAWLAAFAYSLQIYLDFSAYSDMAIGLGCMMGFHFRENFNWPYLSLSITEFWNRWHISLSSWMKEYLYFSLGGNRRGTWITVRNLWLVFVLSGFWHGASWNFILWGVWHGLLLSLERIGGWNHTRSSKFAGSENCATGKPMLLFRQLSTFILVVMGWVLFRASDMNQTIHIWKLMWGFGQSTELSAELSAGFVNWHSWGWVLGGFVAVLLPWKVPATMIQKICDSRSLTFTLFGILLFVSTCWLVAKSYNPFIYFRF